MRKRRAHRGRDGTRRETGEWAVGYIRGDSRLKIIRYSLNKRSQSVKLRASKAHRYIANSRAKAPVHQTFSFESVHSGTWNANT